MARPKKRRTRVRRRRNPPGDYRKLQEEAKRLGLKASGTTAQIKARIAQKKARRKAVADSTASLAASGKKKTAKKKTAKKKTAKKKTAKKTAKKAASKKTPARKKKATKSKKRMSRQQALQRARKARRVGGKHTSSARRTIKKSPSRQKRGVAKTYMRARSVAMRAAKGRLEPGAAKLAKEYGLTKVNPNGIKGAVKSLKTMMVPTILPAAGGFVGAAALGQMAGNKLAKTAMVQKQSATVKSLVVPVSTLGITLAAFVALRNSKKMQRAAMPVLVGGSIATIVHALLHTKAGQDVAKKLKLPIALSEATDAQGAKLAEDAQKIASGEEAPSEANGLGSYMTVSQYLGYYAPISQQGPSWYGRSDVSAVGDYVDAGPQEAFGKYIASDFPVHTPGPGDNVSVHATLTGLGAYGQQGIFDTGPEASMGSAYPPGGYGAYNDPNLPQAIPDGMSLEETPGGTMITMGEAGIFGGRSSIS